MNGCLLFTQIIPLIFHFYSSKFFIDRNSGKNDKIMKNNEINIAN